MAVPPSDKIPTTKLYRTQYVAQTDGTSAGAANVYNNFMNPNNKKYLHYIYARGRKASGWDFTPIELEFKEDVEVYLDRDGTSATSNVYIWVNGTRYLLGYWGYDTQCSFASYSPLTAIWGVAVTSTIPPLYDPAYADTEVFPIIINKLTQSQYESITPDDTQLYLITDANLETTNHKVQTIDASSTNTQYPSATAVNNVKYRGEPFWIMPAEDAYVGMVGLTMGPSATRSISYSFDGIEWIDTTVKGLIEGYRYVLQGEKIYFKSSSAGRYWSTQFVVKDSNSSSGNNVDFIVGGKLISLFNGTPGNASSLLSETNVTDASKLDINSETTCCTCASLFVDCVVLNTPPVLPATLLPDSAYQAMFYGCISLISAPALPAETLTDFCYMSMFANCTSLRYAPPIKAKTLAEACCQEMFLGCTALETAPELLATVMATQCYQGMFKGCTSLNQIPKLYSTELATSCYNNMFEGCSDIKLVDPISPPTITISTVRYIRDTTSGSTANTSNHWNEIKVWYNGENIGKAKPIYGSNGTTYTNSVANDDVINASYIDLGTGTKSVTVDLGAQYAIGAVFIWHYYLDGRTYYNNVTEISSDGVNWGRIYSGQKAETSSGNQITFTLPGSFPLGDSNTVPFMPYRNLYKIPNTPVFYYDTLWDTNMITAPPSEATVANTLTVAKEPIPFPTAAYELPGTTSFNGSSTYIDTGIQLCDSDKSFTLFVDFQYNGKSQYMATAHGAHEASPYPGVEIQLNSNQDKFYLYYYGGREIAAYDTNRHRAMITHTAGTTNASMMYFDDISQAGPASVAYTNITENLLLGCYQTTGGSKGRYLNGTIYDARIYNEVLSATQIEYLMSGGSWTIKGSTLSGLTFSSNSTDYDSMYCDNTGNLYYGASGINTKVYDVSTGWVSDAYKSLIVPSDKSLFENLFVNQGDAQNLFDPTQTSDGQYISASGRYAAGSESRLSGYIPVISGHSYTWTGISGKTGTNNKRVAGCSSNLATSYTMINSVAVTGQNVAFTNGFTVPSGITYVRLSFNIQDTDIILVDNDAISTGAAWRTFKEKNLTIIYGWSVREQSLSLPFKSNSTDYFSFNVNENGNILYDTTTVYNASTGWVNSSFQTIQTTFHTSLIFVDADTWLPFYTINKSSVTGPTTITVPNNALTDMFTNTGGTFTGTPTINKAYFTDADIVPNWYDSLSPGGI